MFLTNWAVRHKLTIKVAEPLVPNNIATMYNWAFDEIPMLIHIDAKSPIIVLIKYVNSSCNYKQYNGNLFKNNSDLFKKYL